MDLRLRPLTRDDLPVVQALSAARNVHEREYARFLALEGAAGLVLEQDQRVVGVVTMVRYFEHGYLGPALMAEGHESGAGATIALLHQAIERLRASGVTSIETQATEADSSILLGLGFAFTAVTTVWERAARPLASAPASTTRAMSAADLLDVGALDAEAVGWGRKQYVDVLRAEQPESARVVESVDGDITGFALAREARRGHHVGPLVTRPGADAAALLRDAIAPVAEAGPVTTLANDRAASVVRALGFAPVGTLARMRAGPGELAPAERPAALEWLLGGRLTG